MSCPLRPENRCKSVSETLTLHPKYEYTDDFAEGADDLCTHSYWNGYQDSLYANNLAVAQYFGGLQPAYQNINTCYIPPEEWAFMNMRDSALVIPRPFLPIEAPKTKTSKSSVEQPSKATLFLWVTVLLLLALTIVVLPIIAISKMHTISSASISTFRQFSGKMLITEGSLLKFDGLLLQRTSDEFALHAMKFQKSLDDIFQSNGYGKKYAGSETTQFRLVPSIPALEVSFIIKTSRDLDVDAYDLVMMLRKHISQHGFDGNSVDVKSISFVE